MTQHATQPTILLVEDNGALRRLMMRILAGCGYAVLEAANGEQALQLFAEHSSSIDLAIIEMVMPGMGGLDVAADLERQRPGAKILYISGHASNVAIDSISRRHPDRVLIKPFDAGELIDRVVQLLQPDEPQADSDGPPAGQVRN
jgi:CheY-like chemotaxis protein